MESQKQTEIINEAKGLAKLFSVKIEIRLFGQLVWSWTWPPKSE